MGEEPCNWRRRRRRLRPLCGSPSASANPTPSARANRWEFWSLGVCVGGGLGLRPSFYPCSPSLRDSQTRKQYHFLTASLRLNFTLPPFHFSTRNGRDARCPARLPKKCEKATMQAERRFGIIRGMTKNAKSFAVTALAIAGAIAEPLRSAASGARSVEVYLDLSRPKLPMKGSKR